jgi:hypothetical protein
MKDLMKNLAEYDVVNGGLSYPTLFSDSMLNPQAVRGNAEISYGNAGLFSAINDVLLDLVRYEVDMVTLCTQKVADTLRKNDVFVEMDSMCNSPASLKKVKLKNVLTFPNGSKVKLADVLEESKDPPLDNTQGYIREYFRKWFKNSDMMILFYSVGDLTYNQLVLIVPDEISNDSRINTAGLIHMFSKLLSKVDKGEVVSHKFPKSISLLWRMNEYVKEQALDNDLVSTKWLISSTEAMIALSDTDDKVMAVVNEMNLDILNAGVQLSEALDDSVGEDLIYGLGENMVVEFDLVLTDITGMNVLFVDGKPAKFRKCFRFSTVYRDVVSSFMRYRRMLVQHHGGVNAEPFSEWDGSLMSILNGTNTYFVFEGLNVDDLLANPSAVRSEGQTIKVGLSMKEFDQISYLEEERIMFEGSNVIKFPTSRTVH